MPFSVTVTHRSSLFRLIFLRGLCWLLAILACTVPLQADSGESSSARMWRQLLNDAARLKLPTKFLKALPADFVQLEFDDLRTYAAEYHPDEHRLVLNRTLSFNAAGGILKPLAKLTHKELEVLYHELFHAYMDFLSMQYEHEDHPSAGASVLRFARNQQRCHYGEVAITPVLQRKGEAETRYLTESESWEALNETWAVFIGWAIWNQLEIQQKSKGLLHQDSGSSEQWISRLEGAVQAGELKGYYVPEDPDERRIAQKRFLAAQSQISGGEAVLLMTEALGFPENFAVKLKARSRLASFFRDQASCDLSSSP